MPTSAAVAVAASSKEALNRIVRSQALVSEMSWPTWVKRSPAIRHRAPTAPGQIIPGTRNSSTATRITPMAARAM